MVIHLKKSNKAVIKIIYKYRLKKYVTLTYSIPVIALLNASRKTGIKCIIITYWEGKHVPLIHFLYRGGPSRKVDTGGGHPPLPREDFMITFCYCWTIVSENEATFCRKFKELASPHLRPWDHPPVPTPMVLKAVRGPLR